MEGYVPGFFSGWKKIIFVIFGQSQAKLTNFMSNLNQFSIYMALLVSPSFTRVKLQDNTTNKFKNAITIIMLFKNYHASSSLIDWETFYEIIWFMLTLWMGLAPSPKSWNSLNQNCTCEKMLWENGLRHDCSSIWHSHAVAQKGGVVMLHLLSVVLGKEKRKLSCSSYLFGQDSLPYNFVFLTT